MNVIESHRGHWTELYWREFEALTISHSLNQGKNHQPFCLQIPVRTDVPGVTPTGPWESLLPPFLTQYSFNVPGSLCHPPHPPGSHSGQGQELVPPPALATPLLTSSTTPENSALLPALGDSSFPQLLDASSFISQGPAQGSGLFFARFPLLSQ